MSAFSACGLISIVIPAAVRSIESLAFAGCNRLLAVDFESGSCLISIGDKAFWNSSLPYIVIPSSTEQIAASAFGHCKFLSIGASSNHSFSVLSGFLIRRADRCALRYFGRAVTVVLPDEVEVIGAYCFSSCKTVKVVRSSPALAAIGEFAFAESSVVAVHVPEKAAAIDALAFRDSEARPFSANPDLQIDTSFIIHENVLCGTFRELAQLTIPRNVKIIASSCFAKSNSIRIVEFEEGSELLRIEDRAFAVSSLQSIAIPKKVEVLGDGVFDYCLDLTQFSFELPAAVRRIGAACFDRTELTTIYIPQTVEFIGARAFMDSKLSVLSLGNARLTTIERQAFSEVWVTEVSVPPTVEVIGEAAFRGCHRLRNLFFGTGSRLRRIEKEAFKNTPVSVVFPATVEFIGTAAFAVDRGWREKVEVVFQKAARLRRVEAEAFLGRAIDTLLLPVTVEFVGPRAFPLACEIQFEGTASPELDHWNRSRATEPECAFQKGQVCLRCDG
jgi:hypothetical protein